MYYQKNISISRRNVIFIDQHTYILYRHTLFITHDSLTRSSHLGHQCRLSNPRIAFLSTRNRFTLFDKGHGAAVVCVTRKRKTEIDYERLEIKFNKLREKLQECRYYQVGRLLWEYIPPPNE